MLLPTLACQASCTYCFARKTGGVMDEATATASLDLIARIAPAGRDFRVTFHGGEPLLAGMGFYRRILPQLVSRFGRRVHLSVQSNLWGMTDELAELFAEYRVSVGTSLDGPKDMCTAQRGEGYYEKNMAGQEMLRRHGIAAGTICTFTDKSAYRAAEVFRESTLPYAVHGAVPVLEDEKSGGAVSPYEMKKVLIDSYEAYKNDPAHCRITTIDAMARGVFDGKGTTCTFFNCLGTFAAIDPDGDVYACQRFCGLKQYSLGNVRGNLTEADILNSPGYALLLSAQDGKKTVCGDCVHWDHCMGGCLYSTLTWGGEKDPYCEAYRAVFDRITHDMALEMGAAMLGRKEDSPVLAMAGDVPHPYELRKSREYMRLALKKGRTGEGFGDRLRSRWPENDLNKLYLHVTFACPLRCSHCYASGGTAVSPELLPEQFAEIIREACDRRFQSVVITGGEPLVYSGFDELCKLLTCFDRKGTKLILRTSLAFPVPKERLEMICGSFDEIAVSVDGGRDTHDARRGEGRYDLTIAALEAASSLGAVDKFSLAAALTRAQADGEDGQSVYALAGRLGIKKVRMRPVLPLGRASDTQREPWQMCAEEMEYSESFRPRHSCGLGQNLYVRPDGSAFPCYAWCEPDKQLGDLSKETLADLLDGGGLYEYCRHDVDTNEKCRVCEVRYLCGGICKAWARDRNNADSGDFDCTDRREYYRRIAARLEE